MLYSHVIDDALDTSVGAKGLSRASLDRAMAELRPALDKIRHWHDSGELPRGIEFGGGQLRVLLTAAAATATGSAG